jgi:anti-anti-sigma factor
MDRNLPRVDEPPVILVRFGGNLARHEDPGFEIIIQEILDKMCLNFIFDFNRVKYLDSAGIGLVIKLASMIEKRGGSLLLCNPQKNVRSVFSMLGIDNRFRIFDDLGGALENFGRLLRLEIININYEL